MLTYEPFWGMHFFWWIFWIVAMIGFFGYNVPLRSRLLNIDPQSILRKRFAKDEISELEYNRLKRLLRKDEEFSHIEVSHYASKRGIIGNAFVEGLSFSATWATLYCLFSVIYWIDPVNTTSAANKLFFGIIYSDTISFPVFFKFADFISVLSLGAVYTFVIGITWSLVHLTFLKYKPNKHLKKISTKS